MENDDNNNMQSRRTSTGDHDATHWMDAQTPASPRTRVRLPRKPHAAGDARRGPAGLRAADNGRPERNFAPPDNTFAPTLEDAQRRLSRVRPNAYAKTRNFLDGAVTRLSPYITHGYLNIPDCIEQLCLRYPLTLEDKLIYEFAWREYFHHVWTRLGDGILSDIRNPIWRGRYDNQLPDDIRAGATGVAVIDAGIRSLYEDGYLHNHMRMWIASYVVHMRKVDWKVGARWMYSHLLDGDLASNWLSWQWVAGTFAHKPYLFNAENVSRYAAGMDCSGTVIDTSYVDLEAIARGRNNLGPEPGHHARTHEPACPSDIEAMLRAAGFTCMDDAAVASRLCTGDIHLRHPWDLSEPQQDQSPVIGWLDLDFHAQFPWSEKRWHFVLTRLRQLTDCVWFTRSAAFVGKPAHLHSLYFTDTLNPGYAQLQRDTHVRVQPAPRFFANPVQLQPSFTRFFDHAMAGRELAISPKAQSRYSA